MGNLISLYSWVVVLSRNLTFTPPTHNHAKGFMSVTSFSFTLSEVLLRQLPPRNVVVVI